MRRLGWPQRHHCQSARRSHRRSRHERRRHGDPDRDPGDLRRRAAVDGARRRRTGVRRHRGAGERFQALLPRERPARAREPVARQHRRRHHDARRKIARRRAEGRPCNGDAGAALWRASRAPGPRAIGSAGQRRHLVHGARRGRCDGRAVHDRSRHAARLSGADAEDQLELAARAEQTALDRLRRRPHARPAIPTRWRKTSCA